MGNINNSNDSEKKGLDYCILQFKKKNQIYEKTDNQKHYRKSFAHLLQRFNQNIF